LEIQLDTELNLARVASKVGAIRSKEKAAAEAAALQGIMPP
jgi:hypothetical protein